MPDNDPRSVLLADKFQQQALNIEKSLFFLILDLGLLGRAVVVDGL